MKERIIRRGEIRKKSMNQKIFNDKNTFFISVFHMETETKDKNYEYFICIYYLHNVFF